MNNKNTLHHNILKRCTSLNKLQETYISEREKLLNHKKMIEYLFNKPLIKIICAKDLLIDYKSSIKIVRLELKDKASITGSLFIMAEILKRYSGVYCSYEKLINQNKNNNGIFQFKSLPVVSKLSLNELKIMQILDKLMENSIKIKLFYVYEWTFLQEGNHLSVMKRATINYEQAFIYDFYCVIINHGQLVQFVIEYDNDTHFDSYSKNFKKIHTRDIIKQIMLFQMNINLLRLNKNSDMKKEITAFIKKIKNTTKYIIWNKIIPVVKYLDQKHDSVIFCKDYEYNHIIFLKIPFVKTPKYDSDEDEFFEYLSTKDNYKKKICR